MAWIEQRLDQPLTLEQVAARAGVHAPVRHLAGPDFELYDGRFDLRKPGAVIDFHVPVAA